MGNPTEVWKAEKHGFDVWPDVLEYARTERPMKQIDNADLERMKWHGFFYRKRDAPGRYMTRIRVTAGELTAEQAREIAYIAYEYGHGIVDITTRANIQVQGLPIKDVPKVADRLNAVGLTAKQTGHDNIRNVFAHPYSGLLPDELIDTRELCHQITGLFLESRDYADLPRKFNICLNGTADHSAHFWTQDLSFLAFRDDEGDVAFRMLIGGTQGQNPLLGVHVPVVIRPDQVLEVTRSLLDLFRAKGNREKRNGGRFRFLVEKLGVGGVLDHLDRSLPFRLEPSVCEPSPASQYDDLIGWFRQRNTKLWTMGLCVPLGRLTWQQLEGLALMSRKWGNGQLRTTHEQGIAVVNIPHGFRDAAGTDAASLHLSVHADPLARNTMACTGSQFCNIAVTETKGQMFQLIESLRKRALMLHGIRIHMSGCPSSCAQHFTADIGLKGVRVRRLLGTREGFDVFLGGGVSGQVHLGIPYKCGVDADQLPHVVEEVVNEYYLRRAPGQTFSAYWRERLREAEAAKVGDEDYQLPVWVCDGCDYHYTGEDPPVFCPGCAGLRRLFARIENEVSPAEVSNGDASRKASPTSGADDVNRDGFVFAVRGEDLKDGESLAAEIDGRECLLYRSGKEVYALDNACPHEGAPLSDGEIVDGVIHCPWHGWTFDACSGCSIEPKEHRLIRYETRVTDGNIYVRVQQPKAAQSQVNVSESDGTIQKKGMKTAKSPQVVQLPVLQIITESPDVRTFRLGCGEARLPLDYPGRFVKVNVEAQGKEQWRSFTISSSPTESAHIDLTIKLNPDGQVSKHLFEQIHPNDLVTVKGPLGGFYFDPEKHQEPLVLISAGSGITPMISIARFLKQTGAKNSCLFLYGARTIRDILFHEECLELQESQPQFQYRVSLSEGPETWDGWKGRLDPERLFECLQEPSGRRYFICGPNQFMETFQQALLERGVPEERIHTEQFHKTLKQTPVES